MLGKFTKAKNCHTSKIRSGLQEVIAQNKAQYPSTFRKKIMKKNCLKDLLRARQLERTDDVDVFDRALESLSSEVLTQEDLVDLLSVFIDQTRHEEVMYGLLHLIEKCDVNLVVAALLQVAPDMKTTAYDWLDTFIYRLLNGDYSRNILIDHLKRSKGMPGATEIFSRLMAMKEDTSEKIRERASFALSKLD